MESMLEAWKNYYRVIFKLQHLRGKIESISSIRFSSLTTIENEYKTSYDAIINNLPEEIVKAIKSNKPFNFFESKPDLEPIYQNALLKIKEINTKKSTDENRVFEVYYEAIETPLSLFDENKMEVQELFEKAKNITRDFTTLFTEAQMSSLMEYGNVSESQMEKIRYNVIQNVNESMSHNSFNESNILNLEDIKGFIIP